MGSPRPYANFPARTNTTSNVDLLLFAQDVRELNEKALRVLAMPLDDNQLTPAQRLDLENALSELESNVKALRGAFILVKDACVNLPSPARPVSLRASQPGAPALGYVDAMIANGLLVPPLEFQEMMGWKTRQAVWKAVDTGRVFYITYKSEPYFPRFYADPAYERKQLEAVTYVLGDLPGGSKLQFFLNPRGSLGGISPLDAMAAGRVNKVKDVAAAFAEV